MSKFITEKDQSFFQSINRELIIDIVNTSIIIYKPSLNNSINDDLYEESVEKVWNIGVQLDCLIDRSDQSEDNTDFGLNNNQSIKFSINREQIKQKNIYPEIGDIVEWNNFYYETDNVYENQYIAGRYDVNWSIIIDAHLTNKSMLNIENIHK